MTKSPEEYTFHSFKQLYIECRFKQDINSNKCMPSTGCCLSVIVIHVSKFPCCWNQAGMYVISGYLLPVYQWDIKYWE